MCGEDEFKKLAKYTVSANTHNAISADFDHEHLTAT